jgi:hypothetical protein
VGPEATADAERGFRSKSDTLAEVVAGSQHGEGLSAGSVSPGFLFDAHRTGADEEHRVARIALGEDGLAVSALALLQSTGEAGERGIVERLKHRNLFEFVEVHWISWR